MRDNDRAYGQAFRSRVMAMGIRDRPISPGSPWQNPYVERLIGTVRRECLDRMLVLGESHLRQILSCYAAYYNEVRTHLALGKDAGRAVDRYHRCHPDPVRPASPLRPDMIFGKDRFPFRRFGNRYASSV